MHLQEVAQLPVDSSHRIVIVMAYDQHYVIGSAARQNNETWANKRGFAFVLYQMTTAGEMPHFMRYRALLNVLQDKSVTHAVYVDGDAIIHHGAAAPVLSNVDVTFGNEFWYKGPPNTGYIAVRNTVYSKQWLQLMIGHPMCDTYRTSAPARGRANALDQGCLNLLLSSITADERNSHFGWSTVQCLPHANLFDPHINKLFFMSHQAGHYKQKDMVFLLAQKQLDPAASFARVVTLRCALVLVVCGLLAAQQFISYFCCR